MHLFIKLYGLSDAQDFENNNNNNAIKPCLSEKYRTESISVTSGSIKFFV